MEWTTEESRYNSKQGKEIFFSEGIQTHPVSHSIYIRGSSPGDHSLPSHANNEALNHILITKPTRCTDFSNVDCLLASSQHNLYDIYLLLRVQYQTPDDGQRNCLKHVEFYSKNKFEKSVHLVGFIMRIYHDAWSFECQIP